MGVASSPFPALLIGGLFERESRGVSVTADSGLACRLHPRHVDITDNLKKGRKRMLYFYLSIYLIYYSFTLFYFALS